MGLPVFEQKTSLLFMRDSDICTVYTSDSTVMTKLDKLVENPKAPHWKLKEEHRLQIKGVGLSELNKTVFLSREEAEKALEGKAE